MSQLARWCYRNRRRVVAFWSVGLVGLLLTGVLLGGAFQNDFRIAGAESQASFELLQERFPEFYGDPLSIAFKADAGVADPAVRAEMELFFAAIDDLDGVRFVISPYGGPTPISADGTIGFAQVQLEEFGPAVAPELVRDIIERADDLSEASGLEVNVGGPTAMFAEMEPPGGREGAGVLLALVILVITFGSVIAAGLPIIVAVCGLAAGMSLVLLSTRVLEIFTFAPAMAAMIGLGVGIDYALFIVTRYRQGLDDGLEPEDAVALALDTSGRAVIFAGATVVISMLGMVLMGVSMVVGMATSAALAVVCTVVAAITLLPAMLGFAGRAIDHLSIPGLHHTDNPNHETFWHRWSRWIQRHPWRALLVSLAILLTLSWPALDIQVGGPQFGAGPESHSSRRAYDLITEGFGEGFNGPLVLVAETDPADPSHRDALTRLVEAVGRTDGVVAVAPAIANGAGDTAVVTVIPETAPHSYETEQLVHRLRDDVIPATMAGTGVDVGVSGVTALFVDMADLLNRRLPLFIGTVLVLSFLLLLVVFRSVLVPLKAAVMNLLSIGAAYGVVVAVFQWGWGMDLIGVERTGPIMAFIPMMLFAILFGLSMDYEVFLLSRVREEYDRTGNNALAVVDGLAATARVITAAAAIMVTIFFSFVLGDDPIIKTFGLGLAVAVFVDATVVRMVLVPATMELLGDANWWFPPWLDRLVPRVSLEAHPPPPVEDPSMATSPAPEYALSQPADGAVVVPADERAIPAEDDAVIPSDDEAVIRAEAQRWFEENWDPDLNLASWWERLAASGYAVPTWPADWHGRAFTSRQAGAVHEARKAVGALGAPSGIGMMMAGPTIVTHGTDEQRKRFLPNMVNGKEVWCQLFSEPGSGSDLASLATRATRDGDEWVVNGQKVWTSGAQFSKWGILIARTNPDQPKHRGITYFVIDMNQPGIDVRPLKEMTGGATFNEVFFTDARVPHENVIGAVDDGWGVAVTTLAHERNSLGAGGMGGFGGGDILGRPPLDARVGDLVGRSGGGEMAGMAAALGGGGGSLIKTLPQMFGRAEDPVVRQDVARIYSLLEIARYTGLRAQAAAAQGRDPGPEVSTGKLMASDLVRALRDVGLGIQGAQGMLVGADAPMGGMLQALALFSPAVSIAGGSDQVQRNIIGERVLGLPAEPRLDKAVAYKDTLVGTQNQV